MGLKEDCMHTSHPILMVLTPFYAMCLLKLWFLGTTYCRDFKQVPLDLACIKPYIHATQTILMHFSHSKSTKCEILAVSLTPPDKK